MSDFRENAGHRSRVIARLGLRVSGATATGFSDQQRLIRRLQQGVAAAPADFDARARAKGLPARATKDPSITDRVQRMGPDDIERALLLLDGADGLLESLAYVFSTAQKRLEYQDISCDLEIAG